MPVDMSYIRGWADCLQALSMIEDEGELKNKIATIKKMIWKNQFEKIQTELGIIDLFKQS